MIDERKDHVLELLVREYIKNAEPVSSGTIAERLSVSPATIRNTLTELTDEGYIEQAHTSGGRIPKDRAYRFFVNRLLLNQQERAKESLKKTIREVETLQHMLARHVHVLSRFGELMPIGFDEMFGEPEFREPSFVRELGRFLDEFEHYRAYYEQDLEPNSFDVLIGEENNIQPMIHMSIVVAKDGDGELFFAVGPTRMRYDKIINTMKLWNKIPKKK
ncbi:MAG: HTH domain-containing protein [bacterium]|nr:HTH domain-containing protein [bacterium]